LPGRFHLACFAHRSKSFLFATIRRIWKLQGFILDASYLKNGIFRFNNISRTIADQVMTPNAKLNIVKGIHSLIWVFFNVVLIYLYYAVISDRIDKWVWIAVGIVIIEAIVLLIFKRSCPITLIARKYSDSAKDNFDIFLPNWLAKYNKIIYSILFVIVLGMLMIRIFSN
jgi:hypothetical protein